MAQGTPVIGSNAGGTPELLQFGKVGLLYITKNEYDLAEKMKTAMEEKQQFTSEILIKSIQKFNGIEVCEKVEEVLKCSK